MKNTQTSEIILCNICGGNGIVYKRVSAYDHEKVNCESCSGNGRLIKIINTLYKKFKK